MKLKNKKYKAEIAVFLFLACFCSHLFITNAWAHPGHTDSRLAELNDYLMALQVMRHSDPDAELLFQRWQELREASWKIRELTDEHDLPIDDPEVAVQIERTIELREALLVDCRTFFREKTSVLPTVRIHLDDQLNIHWDEPVVTAPVGSRGVILVEITSSRSHHAHLRLTGEANDHILFWAKSLMVTDQNPVYTFIYAAPLEEGPAKTSITVNWADRESNSFPVHVDGTLPATYEWYNHVPAATMFDMDHREDEEYQDENRMVKEKAGQPIRFHIRDHETGEPMPVRVEVRDDAGNAYWTPLRGPSYAVERDQAGFQTPLWPFQQGPFFYIGGDAELGVEAEGKTVHIYRGFEYEPVVMPVPEDGLVNTAPRRWIDMPSKGWYSGHTHIHTTDVGLPVQYSRFWPLVTRAEDFGVSSILTLQGERDTHSIYADEYPMGRLDSHSTQDHHIIFGEEYRNNPYGHLALLDLEYLILPVSSGSLGEIGGPDYPPNQFILDEADSQGGLTIGAHFGHYFMDGRPILSSWPSTGFELPVNVALGNLHMAEIYGAGGQEEIWYKFLNSGFDLPATAGPDWVMKDAPRAYVYIGQNSFTTDNWLSGLRQGRSFITKGPMLFFTVEDKLPGGHLHYPNRPQTITVNASALMPDGSIPVEIIVNGEVVASGTDIAETITLEDSAWIAARTEGAHSNPVYVTLEGRPRGYAGPAREFIEVTEQLEEWVRTKALFENEEQKQTVLNVLAEGKAVYENIIRRAERLGRE
ncbi:MAG: CehA/McbA family metallohydrolase [Balneolaceae bacterium]|nr:CehA/McbA family metallohydrolase [Balneolaceae bacterium]